jgi:hypothetical protein
LWHDVAEVIDIAGNSRDRRSISGEDRKLRTIDIVVVQDEMKGRACDIWNPVDGSNSFTFAIEAGSIGSF